MKGCSIVACRAKMYNVAILNAMRVWSTRLFKNSRELIFYWKQKGTRIIINILQYLKKLINIYIHKRCTIIHVWVRTIIYKVVAYIIL
jgi:hypothetical protein